jgi:hypothetical protein
MAQENSDIHGRDVDMLHLYTMQFIGEPVFPVSKQETPVVSAPVQDTFLNWLAKQQPSLVDEKILKTLQELYKKRILEEKIAELETILNAQDGQYTIYTLPNGELRARKVETKVPDTNNDIACSSTKIDEDGKETVFISYWQKMKCPDCSADFEVAKDENGEFIYRNVAHHC